MTSLSTLQLSPHEFQAVMKLLSKQTWLAERYDALEDLFVLCENPQSRKLITELLDRFYFIRDDVLKEHLDRCKLNIIDNWNMNPHRTFLAPLHNDDEADSSQLIVQMLKARFSEIDDWLATHFYSSAFRAVNRMKAENAENDESLNLVLLDEFIGSGDQAEGVIKSISNHLSKLEIDCDIYVASMVAMKSSFDTVAPLVKQYWSSTWLDRGISDYYVGPELEAAKSNMTLLESLLSPQKGALRLQPFGHRRSETLYKYELGTTPDNVFPVFHWKWLIGNKRRRTVLPPRF